MQITPTSAKPTHRLLAASLIATAALLASAPVQAGNGQRLLQLMPQDTAVVISVDINRLKKSPLANELAALVAKQGDFTEATAELKKKAGFDIERDLHTVAIALSEDFAKTERFIVVMEGRFNSAKFIAYSKSQAQSFAKQKHRGVTYYEVDDDSEMAFIGKHALISSKGLMKKIIDTHRKKAPSATQNAALMTLVNKGDTKKDMWAAFLIPKELRAEIAREADGHSIDALMASVDLASRLDLKVHLDASSNTAASALVALLRSARTEAAKDSTLAALGLVSAVQNMTIKAKGPHIDLALTVPKADLDNLRQMLAKML